VSDEQAVAAAVAELEARPREDWPALLRARFPDDPGLVRQLLLWLAVHRGYEAERDGASALPATTRYELGVRLDSGATASVWRAYDRKLRRNVAIKVFDGGASHAVDEILAEARAVSEVTSEHVVRVLDVHDEEAPYIVMELVGEHRRDGVLEPGASAATCRPRDVAEAMRWVRDVARGVHDAHLRNVFHRDLKPHNVLITPISRRAKVADFGLAVSGAARRAATRIAGTPGYMAPEQARGLGGALDRKGEAPLPAGPAGRAPPPRLASLVDPRSAADRATLVALDVWGLGAIAYDLLAGHPPWQGVDGVAAWEAAASGAAVAALERAPWGERIPPRLRKIVERALSAAPAQRYASAEELANELHAVLASRPTSFDRSPAVRLALWSRRNPQLTVTAAVAVALGGMSLAAYATVLHLGIQRNDLAAEIRAVEADKDRLADQARAARRELETTEASLRTQSASLRELRQSLADTEADYRAIVQARERALHSAGLAAEALAAVRGERDVAENTRALYEGFWSRARKAADDAIRERDQTARERDAARAQAEQAIKERDEARDGRARAENERDVAQAARERDATARRLAEAEIARLIGQLAALIAGDGAPSAAVRDRADPAEPTPKGTGH
jgi:serine/threonine protein kinase